VVTDAFAARGVTPISVASPLNEDAYCRATGAGRRSPAREMRLAGLQFRHAPYLSVCAPKDSIATTVHAIGAVLAEHMRQIIAPRLTLLIPIQSISLRWAR
jgi:hypothetical protein